MTCAPEKPFASAFARSSIAARTTSSGYGSPTPHAWLRRRRSWSSSASSSGMCAETKRPKSGVHAVRVLTAHAVDELARGAHPLPAPSPRAWPSRRRRRRPTRLRGRGPPRSGRSARALRESRAEDVARAPATRRHRQSLRPLPRRPSEHALRNEPDELARGNLDVPREPPQRGRARPPRAAAPRSTSITFMLTWTRPELGSAQADRLHSRHPSARLAHGARDRTARPRRRRSRARGCTRRARDGRRRGRRPIADRFDPAMARHELARRRRVARSSSSPPRLKNAGLRPMPSSP